MTYGTVLENKWHELLPKKNKYTKRDLNKIVLESLFDGKLNNGKTFTDNQARFIVVCTAIYHNVEYSRVLDNIIEEKYPIF